MVSLNSDNGRDNRPIELLIVIALIVIVVVGLSALIADLVTGGIPAGKGTVESSVEEVEYTEGSQK